MGPNNFIFNLSLFLILYIISFIYLYREHTEISSYISLSVFQAFFILFIIQTYSSIQTFSSLTNYMWGTIFVSVVFKFVALILLLTMYRHFYGKDILNRKIHIDLPKSTKNQLKYFKTSFVTTQIILILFLFIVVISNESSQKLLFENTMTKVLMILYLLPIGFTSYELFLGYKFSKLTRNKIIG